MPVPENVERNLEIYKRYMSNEPIIVKSFKSYNKLGSIYGLTKERIKAIIDRQRKRELSTIKGE